MSSTKPHYIHRLNYSTVEKIVGIFVVLALLLFVSLFVVNGRNLHLFEDYIHIDLFVESAEGVALDTPVRVAGIAVGRVDEVEITPEHLIRIRVRIYERYTSMLRTDSKPSIVLSLLGRTSIDFSTGNPELPMLESGTAMNVEAPLSIEDLMAGVTPLMEGVQNAITHLTQLILAVDEKDVSSLLENTTQITRHLESILASIDNGEGLAGKMVKDQQFASQVAEVLRAVDVTLQQTEQRLQQLQPVLEQLAPIMENVAEAAPYIPTAMTEMVLMLEQVNATLNSLQPELRNLPDLMNQVNILMEQTDLLMRRIMGTWPLSIGQEPARQNVEIIPHD